LNTNLIATAERAQQRWAGLWCAAFDRPAV